jgi:hypothetical protein
MLVSDLLNSCTHEGVAEAAIASIGGPFAERLKAEADLRGLPLGAHAAGGVRSFRRDASERDWRRLAEAVRGQDFPVLAGLQLILAADRRRGGLGLR